MCAAVLEHRVPGAIRRCLAQVEIERVEPPLGVEMTDDHLVGRDAHRRRGLGEQLGEQLGSEALAGEREALELLGVDHAPDAIVQLDELVLRHDLLTGGALGRSELVLDDLEHHVVARQREDRHHHALHARSDLELVGRVAQVAIQGTEQHGLAVRRIADGVEQLGDGLHRHERFEEADELGGVVPRHVEVGAREREDAARFRFGQQHGVDHDAFGRAQQRHDEGDHPVAALHPPDEICALVAVEDRPQHVDSIEPRRVPHLAEAIVEALGDQRDVAIEVGVVHCERVGGQDRPHHLGGARPFLGAPRRDVRVEQRPVVRAARQRCRPEPDELEVVVDADGREHLPGHGVEDVSAISKSSRPAAKRA
jgi:hypothetical protein